VLRWKSVLFTFINYSCRRRMVEKLEAKGKLENPEGLQRNPSGDRRIDKYDDDYRRKPSYADEERKDR